jgi:hypothetical protein
VSASVTDRERRIVDALLDLELMPAATADVFIDGHGMTSLDADIALFLT